MALNKYVLTSTVALPPDVLTGGIDGSATGTDAAGHWGTTGATMIQGTAVCADPAARALHRDRRGQPAGLCRWHGHRGSCRPGQLNDPVGWPAVEPTWFSRDLPVLDAAVKLFQSQDYVSVRDLAGATGFEIADVAQALRDMRYVYVSEIGSMGDQADWDISGVTEKARQAVGQWPTPENVAARLAEAFTAAAEREHDPEQKSRLRSVGNWLAEAGKSTAAEVIAKVIGQHTGRA